MKTGTLQITKNIFLIPLDLPITGFFNFIGAYLHTGKPSFLVDVGPAATASQLCAALSDLNVHQLDYILLTHAHLDHAGAIGELRETFPAAQVVCHPGAHAHLQEPSRLQQGTIQTLGDIGVAYGPIRSIPADRLQSAADFSDHGLRAVLTPGHAPHHVSYLFDSYLFAGEAGGVCLPTGDDTPYLRPATPPRFFLDVAVAAIDALIEQTPSHICYGHFGAYENAADRLMSHRAQLYYWQEIISAARPQPGDKEAAIRLIGWLLKKDPRLKGFSRLHPDAQKREMFFLENSVRGYVESMESAR